jgi:hypothetical protein
VCGVWSTWSDVRSDDSILNRRSHRTELSPVDRPAQATNGQALQRQPSRCGLKPYTTLTRLARIDSDLPAMHGLG